jgi:hypothetical protein
VPIERGTEVSPETYLADSSAATSSAGAFVELVERLGPRVGRSELLALAPALEAPLVRARALSRRLGAQRLADARLEALRSRTAAAYAGVVAAMQDVLSAARAGEPQDAAAAITRLRIAAAAAAAAAGPRP